MNRTLLPMTLLAAALLVVGASGSAVAASQTFFLGEGEALYLDHTVPADGLVEVKDGQAGWFFSIYPAAADFNFGSDPFAFTVVLSAAPAAGTTFRVGVGHGDGEAISSDMIYSTTLVSDGVATTFVGTIDPVGDFEVFAGEYMAFVVDNVKDPIGPGSSKSVPNSRFFVSMGGDSFINTPDASPTYPTPELGTIALAGAGLGLVAIVAIRRK